MQSNQLPTMLLDSTQISQIANVNWGVLRLTGISEELKKLWNKKIMADIPDKDLLATNKQLGIQYRHLSRLDGDRSVLVNVAISTRGDNKEQADLAILEVDGKIQLASHICQNLEIKRDELASAVENRKQQAQANWRNALKKVFNAFKDNRVNNSQVQDSRECIKELILENIHPDAIVAILAGIKKGFYADHQHRPISKISFKNICASGVEAVFAGLSAPVLENGCIEFIDPTQAILEKILGKFTPIEILDNSSVNFQPFDSSGPDNQYRLGIIGEAPQVNSDGSLFINAALKVIDEEYAVCTNVNFKALKKSVSDCAKRFLEPHNKEKQNGESKENNSPVVVQPISGEVKQIQNESLAVLNQQVSVQKKKSIIGRFHFLYGEPEPKISNQPSICQASSDPQPDKLQSIQQDAQVADQENVHPNLGQGATTPRRKSF